jgi:hypothetical protein
MGSAVLWTETEMLWSAVPMQGVCIRVACIHLICQVVVALGVRRPALWGVAACVHLPPVGVAAAGMLAAE